MFSLFVIWLEGRYGSQIQSQAQLLPSLQDSQESGIGGQTNTDEFVETTEEQEDVTNVQSAQPSKNTMEQNFGDQLEPEIERQTNSDLDMSSDLVDSFEVT